MKTVLVYRLGSLGDTLVALPALHLVARAFPDARRVMLTNFSAHAKAAPLAAVIESTGLIDEYIQYPQGVRSVRELWALRKRIRALRPDTLVYLATPRGNLRVWRDVLFFRLCGIRRLIGVPYPYTAASRPLDGPDGRRESEGARLARCVAVLGDAQVDADASSDLRLTPAELAQADAALAPLAGRRLLAMSIGTKVDANDWEDARWLPLMRELAARHPGHAMLAIGSADEAARAQKLLECWGDRALNLCGTLSLRAAGAALRRCDAFIGHDSGPMHLAAAVGTRCVAIFSSRNPPGEWFPRGHGHEVLFHDIDCMGCRLDQCVERRKACIRSITVDEVAAAVRRVLRSSA